MSDSGLYITNSVFETAEPYLDLCGDAFAEETIPLKLAGLIVSTVFSIMNGGDEADLPQQISDDVTKALSDNELKDMKAAFNGIMYWFSEQYQDYFRTTPPDLESSNSSENNDGNTNINEADKSFSESLDRYVQDADSTSYMALTYNMSALMTRDDFTIHGFDLFLTGASLATVIYKTRYLMRRVNSNLGDPNPALFDLQRAIQSYVSYLQPTDISDDARSANTYWANKYGCAPLSDDQLAILLQNFSAKRPKNPYCLAKSKSRRGDI